MRAFVAAIACSSLLACLGHQSGPARAQEAAMELNVHTRFGRMELATEHVAPAARDGFLQRRRAWGKTVRVADYELASFRMKGEADAEALVRVAWYRMDQGELRVTTLKQAWRDFQGDWRLVDEARADGDLGLFGEPAPGAAPSAPRRKHFPVIRLGAQSTSGGAASAEGTPPEAVPPARPQEEEP